MAPRPLDTAAAAGPTAMAAPRTAWFAGDDAQIGRAPTGDRGRDRAERGSAGRGSERNDEEDDGDERVARRGAEHGGGGERRNGGCGWDSEADRHREPRPPTGSTRARWFHEQLGHTSTT